MVRCALSQLRAARRTSPLRPNLPVPPAIRLHVSHPELPAGPIEGFALLWAFYVNGYRPELHCQECFRGERAPNFHSRNAESGVDIVLDRVSDYPYVYVCGVGLGSVSDRHRTNLHFPLRFKEGAVAETTTYNGYQFRAENAVAMQIPALPEGWQGLPREHVRCKNFQFGVAYFGQEDAALHERAVPGKAR